MRKALIVGGVAAALALAAFECGSQYLRIRSELSGQRKAAHEEWTKVGEAMERRAAIVSRLASSGSVGERAGVASPDISAAGQAIADARTPREKLAANRRLSAVLERLMADADRSPRLQSDRAFAQWKEELAACDNRLAVARSRYNRALERYNARIQEFPDSLVASVAGLHRDNAYFQTGDGLAQAPVK